MRPFYEKDEDRRREAEVAKQWVNAMGGWLRRAPRGERWDYLWETDYIWEPGRRLPSIWPFKPKAEIPLEIKCRNQSYETLMLSESKWEVLIARAGVLIWATPGLVRWVVPTPHDHVRIGPGGRRDRGDPRDIESCVFIPARLFIPLETKCPK